MNEQTTLTQSGASGRLIGWANFSHWQIVHCLVEIFNAFYIILLVSVGAGLLLCLDVTPSKNALTRFLESS